MLDCLVISMSKLSAPYLLRILLASILMASSSLAAALGLGNIDVQSGLGEPLRAVIKLEGETKSLESACFRLLRTSDQYPSSELRALLTLREDRLGNSNLLVNSQQIMNDPIVRLTLIAECENQISREYVLLLDPPSFDNNASQANLSKLDDVAQSPVVENIIQTPAKSIPNNEIANSNQPQTIPVPSSPPKKKAIVKTPPVKEKEVSANPALSGFVDSGEPRLVLSGGADYIQPDFIEAPLKLQMSFDLKDWPANDTNTLSEEEVSDEVTAMANRLAYLETQMTALQQRNQELESLRHKAASLPADDNALNWATLLVYAFVTLVVIGFIGVAEWLRRRASQRQIDAEVAMWDVLTPTEDSSENDSDDFMTSSNSEADASSSQAKANIKKSSPLPQQATQPSLKLFDDGVGATVNEDILEQAEVFVAHGRANLAIVLLEDYLAEFPSSSPAPWLMLLDLLQRDGMKNEFEAAAIECQRYFNVSAGDFNRPADEDHSSVEDYPSVKQQLVQLWGTPDVIPFLDDLIFNRRLDDVVFNRKIEARTGFKRSAYGDILFLRSIANEMILIDKPAGKHVSATPVETASEDSNFEDTVILSATDLEPEAAVDSPVLEDLEWPEPESESESEPKSESENMLASTHLPEDKSTPLDFEIEFKPKKD